MVFLPEASDFIGRNKEQVSELTKEAEEPFVNDICRAAKEYAVWVSVGLHGKSPETRVYNSHILVSKEILPPTTRKSIYLTWILKAELD